MPAKPCILIVEARYYGDIADGLAAGAINALEAADFDHERLEVPGVFEIPAAIRMAIRSMEFHSGSKSYAGFIALGCVIRGETSHYDYVCGESSRALMDLTTEYSVALGFGVLTCENSEQARVRADINAKNKGGEAAEACMHMMDVKRHFRLTQR
ncbi:MAG: 6,7-dimethyl-8-ribityllumazine synthase [Rhodospirillaceae bacterium]|jgi:6,7-dimethyl-8-ribityllumazine synthase|nr:6,7-dimethyl-8-ribityllumazine synthase [Rhodospirillaceae bacterium]